MKRKSKSKIKILITPGELAGIGPEIILKVYNHTNLFNKFSIKVCADRWMLDGISNKLKLKNLPEECFEPLKIKKFRYKIGESDINNGEVSGLAITKALSLLKCKEYDGLVTLPINKDSLNLAGFKYPGHTEMIGRFLNEIPIMIFYSTKFIASLITTHIPIKKVSSTIKTDIIIEKVNLLNDVLKIDFNIKKPKISLLSLNPHGGENGLLGNEEKMTIIPAIKKLQYKGINISGPFASDGYFGLKNYKNFDLTIGMYHDQILNPFKLLCFDDGVNFSGGISIVRTSPDHGTAFDIAGKGIAKINSTVSAINLASKIILNRREKIC